MSYNSYAFFRRYFNLPRKIRLRWCLIKEKTEGKTEIRFGVWLVGTIYYIDVARRRFFSECETPAISRTIYPATSWSFKKTTSVAHPMCGISFPQNYIADIYRTSWYDGELPPIIL